MKKRLTYRFPWEALPSYGGFFIPTLDVHGIREQGLKEGVRVHIIGKAEPAIKDGKLGVLFTRGVKHH